MLSIYVFLIAHDSAFAFITVFCVNDDCHSYLKKMQITQQLDCSCTNQDQIRNIRRNTLFLGKKWGFSLPVPLFIIFNVLF